MNVKPLVLSLRLGLRRIILISLVGAVLTATSAQRAVGQVGNGWVDDGQAVRLENPIDRVGIGTETPRRKLHIFNDAPSNANDGQLEITGTGITTTGIVSKFMLLGRAFTYGFVQTHNSEPLVLNPIGNNVGIGTTTPGEKLDVRGGAARITHGGNGAVLLDLNSERNWQFRQLGTGAGTALELASVGGGGNKQFVLNTTGNIGIGTTNPREKLHVAGNFLRIDGAGNEQVYIGGDGAWNDVQLGSLNRNVTKVSLWNAASGTRMGLMTSVLEITGGTDLAERFDVRGAEAIEPGMVVAIDPEQPGRLRLASKAYDRTVAGIVSGANGVKPGLTMKREGTVADSSLLVALTGRVYCWADATNSAIQPGDLLTTSDIPGHAMRVDDYVKAQGAIVGKAMTALTSGRGLLLVLVSLQ